MLPRRLVLATTLVAGALALGHGLVQANGRFPASVNVQHIPGDDQSIFLPSTFGLLISRDDGASFRWICEQAVGYSGIFDPDYELEADGTIWATTFDGLRVTHDDGCNWTTIGGPLAGHFVQDVEVSSDGTVWLTTSTGGQENNVYKSTDGVSFTATGLIDGNSWWRTLRIAPSDPKTLYVSGFRPSEPDGDGGMTAPEALGRKTIDGGDNWEPMVLTAFGFGTVPQLNFLAVADDDPLTVWAVAVGGNDPIGDSLYVSTDGGGSWNKILDITDSISAFLAEPGAALGQYTLHIGTLNEGNRVSTDSGLKWTRNDSPVMSCISRRDDGTYFACGANWDETPGYAFALGRSDDAAIWTKVVRFADITGPVQCAPGTVQFDTCESQIWPDLVENFQIGAADAGPTVVDPDAGTAPPPKEDCCSGSPSGAAPWLGALLILLLTAVRRKRAR